MSREPGREQDSGGPSDAGSPNVLKINGTTLVFISGVMNFNGTMEPWSSFNSSA
jgi:hypothetical protein